MYYLTFFLCFRTLIYWTYLSYLWKCNSNLFSKIHQLDIKKNQNLVGHIQESTWYAFLLLSLCHPILLPFPSKKLHSRVYHNLFIKFWTTIFVKIAWMFNQYSKRWKKHDFIVLIWSFQYIKSHFIEIWIQ